MELQESSSQEGIVKMLVLGRGFGGEAEFCLEGSFWTSSSNDSPAPTKSKEVDLRGLRLSCCSLLGPSLMSSVGSVESWKPLGLASLWCTADGLASSSIPHWSPDESSLSRSWSLACRTASRNDFLGLPTDRLAGAGVSVEMSSSSFCANCSVVRNLPSFFPNDPDGFEIGGDTSTSGLEVL